MSVSELCQMARSLPGWAATESLRYQMPKGFYRWDVLGGVAALTISQPLNKFPSHSAQIHAHAWRLWVRDDWPLYCLSTSLLRDFQATDVEGIQKIIPADWSPPLPGFLVALPENALASPDGAAIPYLLIHCASPDLPTSMRTEHQRQISCLFVDWKETVWSVGFGLAEGRIETSNQQTGSSPIDSVESRWLDSIKAIALQIVLSLEYLPELVESPASEAAGNARNSLAKTRTNQTRKGRSPRWIGRQYQAVVPPAQTKGHASPQTHWRRGHWRSQPCGTGRQERRVVWVRPTRVNG
jgi:hypothetical protein